MIEEILDLGAEVIDIESPAADRNREAVLEFPVAFAVQRQKAEIAIPRVGEQWPGDRLKRRWLIELTPEGPQDPVQSGDFHGESQPRIGRVFADQPLEMC